MIKPTSNTLRTKSPHVTLAVIAALSVSLITIYGPAAAADRVGPVDRFSYVLFTDGSQSSTLSGTTDDLQRAKALRFGKQGLLYVRLAGSTYVIRDSASVRVAERIFEPQRRIGAQQGELGSLQATLGQRQATLGAERAQLGHRQAGAQPHLAKVLGRQQDGLGRRLEALGQQQHALGRQQAALLHEQRRLAGEADIRMQALLADAFQHGLAERIGDYGSAAIPAR